MFWEGVVRRRPNVILHDYNQSMIAVARTGKNPKMRHLERTPGISIAWLHEMFKREEYALVYGLSSKMAADIYTKASHDPIRSKHACMLVNIFDQGDVDDPATLEALTLSHDAESGQRQAYGQMVDDVPAFPYTQTPILPKAVYKPGMTSKVGLHEHKGSPVFVVAKMPRHKKLMPGKEDDGARWLHTTRTSERQVGTSVSG